MGDSNVYITAEPKELLFCKFHDPVCLRDTFIIIHLGEIPLAGRIKMTQVPSYLLFAV
jgi:hypothetical protein